MLNQLIYTRCYPHRELKDHGQIDKKDGFGVFSFSEELMADPESVRADLLLKSVSKRSGSKENSRAGMFTVYEYLKVGPDCYALVREDTRARTTQENTARRSGAFIRQCFVGKPKGFLCQWFGADAWDAHLKSEDAYYLDRNSGEEPPWLDRIPDEPSGGYVDFNKIRQFVSDGRREALREGLWFLLGEYDQPAEKRRVLLIRDTPENVELWVAAFACALPVSMAAEFSFVTNRSNLSAQLNGELFYYTDEAGHYFPAGAGSTASLKRHPYCMIVGFHPQDEFCSGLQTSAPGRYEMIDGTAKKACFSSEGEAGGGFYEAADHYDMRLYQFYEEVLSHLNLHSPGRAVARAFDAWEYLFCCENGAEDWTYAHLCSNVVALSDAGLSARDPLCGEILKGCLLSYRQFMEEDEKNGFALLELMWRIAGAQGSQKAVSLCLSERLMAECADLAWEKGRLTKTWEALKHSDISEMILPSLQELFRPDHIDTLTVQIAQTNPATAGTLLDMFMEMANASGGASAANAGAASFIADHEAYRRFLCASLLALRKDSAALRNAFTWLEKNPGLFAAILFQASASLDAAESSGSSGQAFSREMASWWEEVLAFCQNDIGRLCHLLSQSAEYTPQFAGRLLTWLVRKNGRCEKAVREEYCQAAARDGMNETMGDSFFLAWLDVMTAAELPEFIRCVQGCRLRLELQLSLFQKLDDLLIPWHNEGAQGLRSVLPRTDRRGAGRMGSASPEAYREMGNWAGHLDCTCVSASFYDFREAMRDARDAEEALRTADSFSAGNYSIDNSFPESEYFRTIAESAARFADPHLHLVMGCLFPAMNLNSLKVYVEAYVQEAFASVKASAAAQEVVSLCGSFVHNYRASGKSEAFIQDVRHILESTLKMWLTKNYSPKLEEKILGTADLTPEERDWLARVLKDLSADYRPSVGERIVNRLFKKKK
ncbi:MAG: hypothetical protein LUI87_13240 [Lachnospiraceae bacterium]|nr:hypothetical protein [Lachnospiraceae bacterium]